MAEQRGGVLRLECGVRVLDGELSPLSRRWTHGSAVIDTRVLVLTPYVGGVRLFRRRPVRIPVDTVGSEPSGSVGAREIWSARPGLALVRLRSAGATLELCLQHADVKPVIGRLADLC